MTASFSTKKEGFALRRDQGIPLPWTFGIKVLVIASTKNRRPVGNSRSLYFGEGIWYIRSTRYRFYQ